MSEQENKRKRDCQLSQWHALLQATSLIFSPPSITQHQQAKKHCVHRTETLLSQTNSSCPGTKVQQVKETQDSALNNVINQQNIIKLEGNKGLVQGEILFVSTTVKMHCNSMFQ